MICRSCGFANMRSVDVCARCGAKLVWTGSIRKADFVPPRAKKGAAGQVQRLERRVRPFFTRIFSPFRILGRIPAHNLCWAAASIIPGGGHFLQRRFREGATLLALWAAALVLLLGARTYSSASSTQGVIAFWMFFLSTAMALVHFYTLLRALRLPDFCNTSTEARLVAMNLALVLFLSYGLLTSFFGFTG